MQPQPFRIAHPPQLALLALADALMTVPANQRPTLARELIATAKESAARFGSDWGWQVHPAALAYRHRAEGPNPAQPFHASLGTREGIGAFEVALAAFMDAVRAEEAAAEEVAA